MKSRKEKGQERAVADRGTERQRERESEIDRRGGVEEVKRTERGLVTPVVLLRGGLDLHLS